MAALPKPRSAPKKGPEDCDACLRRIGSVGFMRKTLEQGVRLLADEADICRWCDRPLTEEAAARCPVGGFITAARSLALRSWNSNRIVE